MSQKYNIRTDAAANREHKNVKIDPKRASTLKLVRFRQFRFYFDILSRRVIGCLVASTPKGNGKKPEEK
jgi:hypothetical protein